VKHIRAAAAMSCCLAALTSGDGVQLAMFHVKHQPAFSFFKRLCYVR
jgi:hypothetical protein